MKFLPPQIAAPPNSNLKSLRDTIQGHLSRPAVTPFIIRFPSETKRLNINFIISNFIIYKRILSSILTLNDDHLTNTGLCGALRVMQTLALEFLSKNEKRSRKRRRAKCPRKGHTVLWPTFFSVLYRLSKFII